MSQQSTQRISMPTRVSSVFTGLPTGGYVLVVDGQAKTDFKSHDQALKAARELKGRFPMLQIKMGCAADRKCQRTEAKTNNRLEMLDYFDFGRQKEV